MRPVLIKLKKIADFQNPLEIIFGFALALNLFNYYSVDLVFTFFALLALYSLSKSKDKLWLNKLYLQPNLFNFFVFIFVSSCILGYVNTGFLGEDQTKEISNLRWILSFYCCFYAGGKLRSSNKEFKLNSIAFPASLLIILIMHARSSEFGFINMNNRLKGFYQNTNHFALATVLPWAFYVGFSTPIQNEKCTVKFKWTQFSTVALLTVGLVATYSRSSWIGAIAALLFAIFYSKNLRLIILTLITSALGAAIIASNSFGIRDRLLGTLNLSATGVEAGRISVWKVNWQIFLDHPLFGVGIDQASRLYPTYYERLKIPKEFIVGNAHNQYLQILSGAGLIGFLSYLGIFLSGAVYFHRIYKKRDDATDKKVALGAILVIVALFFSSFTDAPFRLHECRNYILLLLGFSAGYLHKAKNLIESL